jgi:CubicO group peptidase (beta-lactamase class C family)
MLKRRVAILLASLVSTLALASADTPANVDAPETLSQDSPRQTPAGTRFVAPAGWSIQSHLTAVILDPPEAGSHIVLVDVKATDADSAVAAAWRAYRADAKWPVKIANDVAPHDGWEQIRLYVYETSANEERGISALALRYGSDWTIVIYDVANAVGGKRAAQITSIYDRLLPKGHERESFAGKTAHPLDISRIDALKEFVESSQQKLDVPGVAIGLIDHGKVVFAGGFGVRELGKLTPIDADTLFMIASNTKALTTLMLARLVDKRKFAWTTPVTQLLPSFKLGDADTTRQVLVKHLICACTGMPRQDLEWLFNSKGASPESVIRQLATMQPTSKFGELFQYSNLMAAAAGFVGGHTLHPNDEFGAAYEATMKGEVFEPLGMHATTFNFEHALRGNHAAPHSLDVDANTEIASMGINDSIRPARPAGGAWSSVNDMLRYIQMELAKGVLPDGRRYVSEGALLARRDPQVAIGNNASYGMGLMVDRTWGVPVVHHGGDLSGFHSDMMWLQEQGVGAVILTNSDTGGIIRSVFQRRLLEVLFDGNPEAIANIDSIVKNLKPNIAAERKRLTVPADLAESSKLAVRYHNAALGDIGVIRAGASTSFDFGAWTSEVASRKNDDGTLSYVTISPGEIGFQFVVANSTTGRALILRDAQHEYRYDEVN